MNTIPGTTEYELFEKAAIHTCLSNARFVRKPDVNSLVPKPT